MTEFRPPINKRSTKDLLEIAAVPEKWNNDAVDQAKRELAHRKITQKQINSVSLDHNKNAQLEERNRANESYSIVDFVLQPIETIIELVVSWELKKDGYLKKARQQKWFRFIFLLIVLIIIIISRKSSSL